MTKILYPRSNMFSVGQVTQTCVHSPAITMFFFRSLDGLPKTGIIPRIHRSPLDDFLAWEDVEQLKLSVSTAVNTVGTP